MGLQFLVYHPNYSHFCYKFSATRTFTPTCKRSINVLDVHEGRYSTNVAQFSGTLMINLNVFESNKVCNYNILPCMCIYNGDGMKNDLLSPIELKWLA